MGAALPSVAMELLPEANGVPAGQIRLAEKAISFSPVLACDWGGRRLDRGAGPFDKPFACEMKRLDVSPWGEDSDARKSGDLLNSIRVRRCPYVASARHRRAATLIS